MKGKVKIFLDDIRSPEYIGWDSNDPNVILCRGHIEFMQAVLTHAHNIEAISFDHDIGVDYDGHDSISFLEEQIYWNNVSYPDMLNCHSDNGSGAERIRSAIAAINRRKNN